MTRLDRESRFDDVDITALTIVDLEDYLSKIVDRHGIIPDPYLARSYELRIAEVQAHVQRELAIRNRRETERQDGLAAVPAQVANVPATALSAAIEALGDVMLEMQRRALLARPGASAKTRELLSGKSMSDEQIGERAASAFEAGAMELARRGHPGATVHVCNPSEEP